MKNELKNKIMENPWFARYYDFEKLSLIGLRDNLEREKIYEKYDFSNASILDVGCNLGKNFIFLDSRNPHVLVGIDLPITIDLAEKVAQLYKLKKTKYFHGNLNDKNWYEQLANKSGVDIYDYSLFVSVYGTKELSNRKNILHDVIKHTKKTLFFEGHHLENHHNYSRILLQTSCLSFEFEGYLRDKHRNITSEIRPFFTVHNSYSNNNQILNKIQDVLSNTGRVVIGIEGLAGSGKTTYLQDFVKSLGKFSGNILVIDDLRDEAGGIYENTHGLYNMIEHKLKRKILNRNYTSLSHAVVDKKYDLVVVSDYRLRKYITHSDITIKIITKNREARIEKRNEKINDFPIKQIHTKHYSTNNFYTLLND